MSGASSTCWTLVRAAAAGGEDERAEFARRYRPVVDAYLQARWRSAALRQDVADAVQDVLLECFKDGGALERADPSRRGGFRSYLLGVARHVAARREERRRHRREEPLESAHLEAEPALQDEDLARVFDRAWARSVMRQAAQLLEARAAAKGSAALRRVEVLKLRFQDGLPLRDIASSRSMNPKRVHKDYAEAREEYEAALRDVVAFHLPDEPEEVEVECRRLLDLLADPQPPRG